MSSQSRLIPISYYNASQEVRLSAYADTIVYEREGPHRNILRAVRFGGYPEMGRGLADAVYAGGTLDANMGDRPLWLESQARRYRQQVMASKLAVAGIIEGNFTEEGLAAMSDVQDMTSQMAKELMLGIRDNVEDIAAAFKKMAMINPGRSELKAGGVSEESEAAAGPSALDFPETVFAEPVPVSAPLPEPAEPRRRIAPEKAAELAAILEKTQKSRRARKSVVDENQLTLFDFVA